MRKAGALLYVGSPLRQGVLSSSKRTRWKTRNSLLAKTPILSTVYLNGSTSTHFLKSFRKNGSRRPVASLLQPLLRLPRSGCIAASAIARYSYLNGTVLAIVLFLFFHVLCMGDPRVQRLHKNRHR